MIENINTYIQRHIQSNEYKLRSETANNFFFENTQNWTDYIISDEIIFSHRNTYYTKQTFRDKFHMHDFCEIVIYFSGNVRYISEYREFIPEEYDIIVTPPGVNHTARLNRESQYERYVIYFGKKAFGIYNDTLNKIFEAGAFLRFDEKNKKSLSNLLMQTHAVLRNKNEFSAVMAYSYILQIFCLMISNGSAAIYNELPLNIIAIREYIDENLTSIYNIRDIATHFHYSREYFSRMFKKCFNISVSEYIRSKRLEYARTLLHNGVSVTDSCFECGFSNVSYFIKCFNAKFGMTPYKYLQSHRANK